MWSNNKEISKKKNILYKTCLDKLTTLLFPQGGLKVKKNQTLRDKILQLLIATSLNSEVNFLVTAITMKGGSAYFQKISTRYGGRTDLATTNYNCNYMFSSPELIQNYYIANL